MAETTPDVLVRRRSSLMVVIAAAATGLTGGYAWRFSSSARPLDLVIALVLAVIALGHGYAWVDSRRPLFVADGTGVRIRLGADWAGLPWERIESVEVENRGRLKDGRVAVLAREAGDVLDGVGRRSRWVAALNRRLYGAPLVAPYGLTTTMSVPDPAAAMERLAGGRARIVAADGNEQRDDDPAVDVPASRDAASDDAASGDRVTTSAVAVRDAGQDSPAAATPAVEGTDDLLEQPAARPPRRRVWAARQVTAAQTPRSVVSMPRQARREERTISLRPAPASFGTLALSDPVGTAAPELPEIDELRRTADTEPVVLDDSDAVAGNVSLIIDATADLSAQAMQRVRSRPAAAEDEVPAGPVPVEVRATGAVIGAQLGHARETLGLSVDELADRTRIRPSVIESIERDDFSPCGGDFYAKGHLRMLARVLGIESAPILQAYDESFAAAPVNAREVFEAELAAGSSGIVRGGSSDAHWGALVAVVVLLLVVWGAARLFSELGDSAPAARTGTSDTGPAVSPRPVHAPPAPPQAHVQVSVAGGTTRVVVRDSSRNVVFSGVLAPGTVRHFSGSAPLRVHAADAGLVSLSVHGRSLGILGPPGSPAYRLIAAASPR